MATVQQGITYAERVVNGDTVAGELARLACQRFLNDLKFGPKRDIYFHEGRAQHVLDFFQLVPHVKGDLAGKPIELMDCHVFILINLFGFVVPKFNEATGEPVFDEDGDQVYVRRFRTAYDEMARKNAKSTLCSGIALYMTGFDGEGGAEVYSAATTRDQARIVFDDAKAMLLKAPKTLGRIFGQYKLNIHQASSNSKFEPLSSDADSLDGLNVHCAIIDELHAHKKRDVYDVIETATGSRSQSLIFSITTAGFNKEGICYQTRDYAIKVLKGLIEDDTFFAVIYTLDEGDDPFDENNWVKANPGLTICKSLADMRRLAKKALEIPEARNNFLTKHLNIWTSSAIAWMDMIKWENCPPLEARETLKAAPCWVGIDLSQKIDICAAATLWRAPNGHTHARFRFWLPEGRLKSCSKQMAERYRGWADKGFLILTDGDVIDHEFVKSDLVEWLAGCNVREVGFDPWSALQFSLSLAEEGLELVEVAQTVKNLSESMKTVEGEVYAERFHHDHNPLMAWMMSNVIVKPDKNENIFPNKETPENKIDGPVSLFTAFSRAIVNGGTDPRDINKLINDPIMAGI